MRRLPFAWLLPLVAAAIIACQGRGADVTIEVRADRPLKPISRLLTGACIEDVNHEIYGGIYSQMIFGESFQEPPPAESWQDFSSYGGHWRLEEGAVRIDSQDGPKLVSDRIALSDGACGVEVRFADNEPGNIGILIRLDQPGVGADKFVGYEVALDAARQIVNFARHRQNYEPLKEIPCAVPVGRWITLEVRLAGSVVEILVDGKSLLRHDDGEQALSGTALALRPWRSKAAYRNLWVQTGAERTSVPLVPTSPTAALSGMWRPASRGNAQGQFAVVAEHPFVGTQSQQITFESGEGAIGIENQGLNRWGLNLVAGKPYEGHVWLRTDQAADLSAALESRDGSQVYAEQKLQPAAGADWQRLQLTLTPTTGDVAGRFALRLTRPGSVTVGHVFLQPGSWGRFKNLPVRRDVVLGLIDQGITVLRYGGSMVNHPQYRWKNMIGPRDRRPPYAGTWYPYSTNGWGIVDFMNLCEAAGFEYIPAFNMGETAQDMADFIDYAKAPADSAWGRKRAADGHDEPYRLKYLELGNEERVDEHYAELFEPLATAVWAKDPDIVLVVGDFLYNQRIVDPQHFAGAESHITNLDGQRRVLQFAERHNREVWFDLHVDTDHPVKFNHQLDGMFSFADALAKIAEGARHKVVVFEYNSGNHAVKRGLANALATQAIMRDGRVPIVAAANCLQPDGQNDNGWNQGLLFLNPAKVWLEPPGYVTQMFAQNYQPQLIACETAPATSGLDAIATRSEDGKILIVQAVNPGDQQVAAQLNLAGFVPTKPDAQVTELSGPADGVNTAAQPRQIEPQRRDWAHALPAGKANYTFPPRSFTIIRFE